MTDKIRKSLERMVATFKPFTLKPIGAPGSQARMDQDDQIEAHREAVEALAEYRNGQ